MKTITMTAALAAGMVMGGALSASAATFDFTDAPFLSGPPYTGSVGAFTFTLTYTPAGGDLTFNGGADAPGPIDGTIFDLAGDGDGLGIDDDEITNFDETFESITLTFDTEVTLTGLAFLDLFLASENDPDPEIAQLFIDGSATSIDFQGNQVVGPAPNYGTGFAEFATNYTGTIFTFQSGTQNDGVGRGDFALAAIQVAPIPLPASALLLGGALGGLGLMRRRRK